MTTRKVVVIVDDSADLIRLYQDYLTEEGFEVHVASSGKEALELFEKLGRVDLLLVDCLMPRMSGTAFLKELLRRNPSLRPTTRVFGMSGLVQESEDLTEMQSFVDRMVEKTSDLNELLEIVQRGVA